MARILARSIVGAGGGQPPLAFEGGFTLLETLVMLAVSAMVAALIIPMSGRGMRDNSRLADHALLSVDRATSETAYRNLLRQAVPPIEARAGSIPDSNLVGNARSLRFPVESVQRQLCPGVIGYAVVRLRVQKVAKGGKLLCESMAGSYQLLEWKSGEASFSYSSDGMKWADAWPVPTRRYERPSATPIVRMSLRRGSENQLLWLERAGDPALGDPSGQADAHSTMFGQGKR